MRKAGPPKAYLSAQSPLLTLLDELAKKKDLARIHIQKGDLSIQMEKRGATR
ncbi:MAG: hypothetical protein HYT78_20095 [Deltaproteobacteria bacterium]|nr:hypothetical protein [Deltaproteobacteria bacterium]